MGSLSEADRAAMWQVLAWYALAVVPLVLHWRRDAPPDRRMGLTWPPRAALGVTLSGVVLAVPVGLWLATTTPEPWGSPREEAAQLATVVPEHFLIFGVLASVLLPGRRLRWPREAGSHRLAAALAVAVAGIAFGLVHIGKPNAAEVASSFPLGILFAGMTVFTGSIWPAAIAHCSLNLIPMVLLALAR